VIVTSASEDTDISRKISHGVFSFFYQIESPPCDIFSSRYPLPTLATYWRLLPRESTTNLHQLCTKFVVYTHCLADFTFTKSILTFYVNLGRVKGRKRAIDCLAKDFLKYGETWLEKQHCFTATIAFHRRVSLLIFLITMRCASMATKDLRTNVLSDLRPVCRVIKFSIYENIRIPWSNCTVKQQSPWLKIMWGGCVKYLSKSSEPRYWRGGRCGCCPCE
jgi:hypothetical protein